MHQSLRADPGRAVAPFVIVAACLAALPRAAAGQSPQYTYTDLGYSGGRPQVNNAGAVLVERGNNLLTGPNSSQDNVVPGGPYTHRSGGSINDAGVVAYEGAVDGVIGIFTRAERGPTGVNRPPPPQALASSDNYTFLPVSTTSPAISNNGTVVFYARARDGSSEGLYTGPNPATDALAVRRTGGPFAEVNHDYTSINNSGVVAFSGRLSTGESGIFTIARGTPFSTVVTDAGPFSFLGSPAINDAGRVAFYAELDNGEKGIFRGPDPVADRVATAGGAGSGAPYLNILSYPDVGGDGTVVFNASRPNGANGVFAGPDPVADRVLVIGDTLFGSRVTSANSNRGAINELGQIAVNYRLADGRFGIVIATPVPDPAGAPLAIAAATAALLGRRWRRRQD
jgi:hypothetical protein